MISIVISYVMGAFVLAAAVYQVLVIAAAIRHMLQVDPEPGPQPPVSILKPLRGRDPRLYEALVTQARQQYQNFEILFAHSDPNEPALKDVAHLQRHFPDVPIRTCRTTSEAPNGKVASLLDLSALAGGGVLVISDSDIRVPEGYLQHVVAPLRDPAVGLVTCLYRAESDHLPGRWEALGISTDFAPSALVARLLGVNEFACGATLALQRATLDRIGGFRSIQDYLADDYQLGRRISSLGLRIWLSRVVVETQLSGESWRAVWDHQVRWARTIRVSRGAGYAGLPITNASVWALAAAAWGWAPAAACLLTLRIAAGLVAGVLVLECRQARRYWFLMPFRDLWGLAIWVTGLVGHQVVWRGEILKLRGDGKLVSIMTKLILLLALTGLPCAAQFRHVKIWFSRTGCASCTESMPDRMRRLRGVDSASVNAQEGTLEVRLVEQNRIRVEQIRDLIEQDGTKALRARVQVKGDLSQADQRWLLRLSGAPSIYEVTGPNLSPGSREITGEIRELHVSPLRIQQLED